MKKKVLYLILIIAVLIGTLFTLTGCNNEQKENNIENNKVEENKLIEVIIGRVFMIMKKCYMDLKMKMEI